ncbi:CPBP family intramembrane glutamic endopeptidase [Desnuesiella massiliensis]|uniref:CPBP family intramembrane glutamic endopeptidase n=1 Tax=Desnuesiella massiliensis TaxID=1650662 RepID=UPI0006E2AEE6|nr:CPBP family intramembrane glutamic endopeptidase [Desnuesiella massiliensis]
MNLFERMEEGKISIRALGFWRALGLVLYVDILRSLILMPYAILNYALGSPRVLLYVDFVLNIIVYFFMVKRAVRKYTEVFEEEPITIKERFNIKAIHLVLLLLIILAYFNIYSGSIGALVDLISVSDTLVRFAEGIKGGDIVIGALYIVFVAPIFEEFLFRGMILSGILKRYDYKKAIFFSSLLFGIIHLNLHQGVNAFFIGLIFGYIYFKTRSLYLCIFAHFLNNFIVIIVAFTGVTDYIFVFNPLGNALVSILLGLIFLYIAYSIYEKYLKNQPKKMFLEN